MNVFDRSCERKEAVRKTAELLRDLGTAFFPLDVHKLLSAFGKQINLVTYADLRKNAGTDYAGPAVDPRMMSEDGFCTRVPNSLFKYGDEFVEGSIWYIYYNSEAWTSRNRFTLMHELGHITLGHHQMLNMDTLFGLDDNPEYKAADKQAECTQLWCLTYCE